MKQPQYQPLSLVREVVIIFAVSNGYLDDIPANRVRDFERDLFRFMDAQYKKTADAIASTKKLDPEVEKQVREMLDEFKKGSSYGDKPAPAAAKPEPAKARA
jgi:F-type H+-transporting ATPase subunit alpha